MSFAYRKKHQPNIPVLYSVALNALEGLAPYIPDLEQLKLSLFSKKLSETNVLQYTAKEKKQIDSLIFEFIKLIRPYFLMPQVNQVLEYVMARFQLHVYHPGFVLEAFLPYHSTIQFVSFVKQLHLKDTVWCFLPQEEPFERSLLTKTLGSTPAVFERFHQLPSQFHDKHYVSFYCLVVLDYLSQGQILDESRMATLMSVILPGLAASEESQSASTFQAACQMMTSALVSKIKLSAKLNASLVDAISRGLNENNVYPSLLCAVSICMHQSFDTANCSDKETLMRFFTFSGFDDALIRAARNVACEPVIGSFLASAALITMNSSDQDKRIACSSFVSKTISQIKLGVSTLERVFGIFLEFPKSDAAVSQINENQEAKNLLQETRRIHFEVMDRIITKTLSSEQWRVGPKNMKAAYTGFINSTFTGTLTEVSDDMQTTLFLGLEHTSSSVRLKTLKNIHEKLVDKDLKREDIPTSVVLSRLWDEDEQVAIYALTQLVPHFESLKDINILKSIIRERHNKRSIQIAAFTTAVQLIEGKDVLDLDLFALFLGILHSLMKTQFPKDSAEKIHIAASRMLHRMGLTNSDTNYLQKMPKNSQHDLLNYNLELIRLVAKQMGASGSMLLDMMKNNRTEKRGFVSPAVQLWLLASVSLTTNGSFETSVMRELLGYALSFLKEMNSSPDNSVVTVFTAVSTADVNEFVLQQFCGERENAYVLASVVSGFILHALAAAKKNYGSIYFWFDAKIKSVVDLLLSSLTTLVSPSSTIQLLPEFLDEFITMPFLTALCILRSSHDVSSETLTAAMGKIGATLSAEPMDYQLCIPALLTLLSHPDMQVRENALHLLELLQRQLCSLKMSNGTWAKSLDIKRVFGHKSWYTFAHFQAKTLSHRTEEVLLTRILGLKNEFIADPEFFLSSTVRLFASAKESKSSSKVKYDSEMVAFLASHVLAAPSQAGKDLLFGILKNLQFAEVLVALLPLLEYDLKQSQQSVCSSFLPYLYTPVVLQSLDEGDLQEPITLFVEMLKKGLTDNAPVAKTALSCLDATLFADLPSSHKLTLAKTVLSLATSSSSVQIATVAKETMLRLPMNGVTFASLLRNVFSSASSAIGSPARESEKVAGVKRRATDDGEATNLEVSDLGVLVCLLEIVQSSKTLPIHEYVACVPQFLDILKFSVDSITTSKQYKYEELAQIVMECIGNIVLESFSSNPSSGGTPPSLAEDIIRIDLIVNTIRVGVSPQTHRAGLRLLSALAPLYPTLMWQNIVPIFTLMGATITKTDDDFTFSIIQKTIESVLHPLLVSEDIRAQEEERGSSNAVYTILDTFIDALSYIPAHRQSSLFVTLIHSLGTQESLYVVIFLLLARFVASRSSQRSSAATAPIASMQSSASELNRLDYPSFASTLMDSFDAETQFTTVLKIHTIASTIHFQETQALSADKIGSAQILLDRFVAEGMEDIITKTRIKLVLYGFILRAFKAKSIKGLLIANRWALVEQDMNDFVEDVIVDIEMTTRTAKSSLKVTAALKACMEDILMLSISIFPPKSFKEVTEGLLRQSLVNPQRRVIKTRILSLLKERLENLCKLDVDLHSTVQVLTKCLNTKGPKSVEGSPQSLKDTQIVISCFTIISTLTAQTYSEALTKATKVICGPNALKHLNPAIVSSSLACLSCFIPALESRIIPFLPDVVNSSLDVVSKNQAVSTTENSNAQDFKLCQESGLLLLESCLTHIPHFMSGYLEKIIMFLSEVHRSGSILKVQRLEELISSNVPVRVLYSKVFVLAKRVFTTKGGQLYSPSSLNLLNRLIKKSLPNIPVGTHGDHTASFIEYFMTIFDYRQQLKETISSISPEKLLDMESKSIDLFVSFSMKLNDAKFKPMFFKIVEWGTWNPNESHEASREEAIFRCQVLYHLIDGLFGKLQSLFTSYYVPVLDLTLNLLEGYFVKSKSVNAQLWKHMISSLTQFFAHDTADSNTKALRYKKLVNVIADQMGLDSIHGVDYEKQMDTFLIPCISTLAAGVSENSTSQDSLLKALNRQVLQNSRHASAKVRLSSISAVSAMYKKCGEEMLPLFPETIPFLAELLEDDDIRVEKACRALCLEIEAVLGEPIQPFFESQ